MNGMPFLHALLGPALWGLAWTCALAALTWLVSLLRRDASIVDRVWSLLIVGAGFAYAQALQPVEPRTTIVLALALVWALRLAGYITWRNWGTGEDKRYVEIRKRNAPGFALKSLYLVFGLQAVLAWLVSASLLAAVASDHPLGVLDTFGAALMLFGIVYEALADFQLARFKGDGRNKGRVFDRGLWRHTRHPNYFGEFCVWWGAYAIALSAGGWWAFVSPLVMSVLLLKVSGVTLLDKDLGGRGPEYREYIRTTNAFFPGPRKGGAA